MAAPITKTFPRLTGRRATSRLGVIPQGCPPIVIREELVDQVLKVSDGNIDTEIGGFLLGDYCHDPTLPSKLCREFIEISGYVEAQQVHSGYRSLTFTHESWADLHRQLSTHYPDQKVVGWHHTHPGFGIFLSRQDEFIHRNFFDQPWQVALVVDPQRGELGFFQWQNDQIVDAGFLVTPDRKKRGR